MVMTRFANTNGQVGYVGYTTRRRSYQLMRGSQPLSERSDSSLDKKLKVKPIGIF